MKESKTFPVIDILKFFFALCIVAVHVWFLYDTKIGYYLYTMLYRLGVPFFFFTSGYFLANKVAGNDAKSKFNSILKKTFVRYILLSIICVLINLIKDNNFTIYTVLQNMYQIIIGNCWGIAWFLGALLYSYLIIYFIKDKKTMKISITIALVLHFFGLLCTTYCFLIKYNDYSQFYKFFIEKFYNNSNFLFEGFLEVGLGYYINAYSEK